MAKELHTLERCLSATIHHVQPHKVTLMIAGGAGVDDFKYRFQLVRENTEAALKQIKKIREAAKRANCKEVLALLDEESVPAGHDFSPA